MLKWIWLAIVVVVFDQLTKYIASTSLELHQPLAVMPMFNWTLMHNPGAAFSFLATEDGWQRWFFATIAVVVSVVIFLWIKKFAEDSIHKGFIKVKDRKVILRMFDEGLRGYSYFERE